MSKAVTLELGQQVPAQLEIEQNDIREDGHHIVIKSSSLDLIEIIGQLATVLKGLAPRRTPSKSGYMSSPAQ
eukprot:11804964-Prorocentrum_lima.AAC.1